MNRNKIILVLCIIILVLLYILLRKKETEGFQSEVYTAVIIEPRQHKAMAFVLKNFLENLDDSWNILVLHGNNNKQYIEDIINTQLASYSSRITLDSLNVDNLTWEEYSNLMVTPSFYDKIPSEVFMIFQTDSMIIPRNKDNLKDFMNYDYVGGPADGPSIWEVARGHVVNGGLSIRKKSKMLEILQICPPEPFDHGKRNTEDIYFAILCPEAKITKPSFEEAKRFSSESVLDERSFGIHKPWGYNSIEAVERVFPEAKELYNLQ